MRSRILVKRYTGGLAAALKTEEEFGAVSRELAEFSDLLESNEIVRRVLLSPYLEAAKKARIIGEIISQRTYRGKTGRFLLLLLRQRRLDLLLEVVAALPDLWKKRHGVVAFEVRSVVSLSDSQRSRLEKELSRLERRPVFCNYLLDSGLVGGLTIKKGNLVYDVSLRGQLERFKENIRER